MEYLNSAKEYEFFYNADTEVLEFDIIGEDEIISGRKEDFSPADAMKLEFEEQIEILEGRE